MAIFGKSDQPAVDESNTTVIAAGTKVRGEISIECKLHVDGEFTGLVRSTSIITVGKNGLVEGDIASRKLIVTGRFVGTADCEEIEILSGGKVMGQIASKVLVIERGSFFEGESRLKDANNKESGKKGGDKSTPALGSKPATGNAQLSFGSSGGKTAPPPDNVAPMPTSKPPVAKAQGE